MQGCFSGWEAHAYAIIPFSLWLPWNLYPRLEWRGQLTNAFSPSADQKERKTELEPPQNERPISCEGEMCGRPRWLEWVSEMSRHATCWGAMLLQQLWASSYTAIHVETKCKCGENVGRSLPHVESKRAKRVEVELVRDDWPLLTGASESPGMWPEGGSKQLIKVGQNIYIRVTQVHASPSIGSGFGKLEPLLH